MATSSFASIDGSGTSSPSASSFSTFGSSTPTAQAFGSFGTPDPNTIDGLVQMANVHGGAVAQAANAMTHPTTGILSSIGGVIHDAFTGFVNTLSLSSEVVAGAISSDMSIQEAIDKHIRPSDVIFGKADTNMSTMQKVGNFLVRTATDVLTDPLTYVTFGAGEGVLFGARAVQSITMFDKAGILTKAGATQLDYLTKVARQSTGLQSALSAGGDVAHSMLPERLKTFQEIKAMEQSGKIAPEVMTMGKDELRQLLNVSIDSPLNPDFAKQALAKTFEANPALVGEFIDKGGIKFFGKSLLSGQRINSVVSLIPGMTWLDHTTEQSRLAISSLFDPSVVGYKVAGGGTTFQRLPSEFMDLQKKASDLADYMKDERIMNITNIMRANKIDPNTSGQFLMAAVENGVMPADAQLANAYKQLLGYGEKELNYLRGAGIPISKLDSHVPHILVDSGIKVLPFKMPPSTKVGGAIQRTMEGGIFNATPENMKIWEEAVVSGNKQLIADTVAQTKRAGFEIFDDNIFTAHIARSIDNTRSATMKQLVDSLAGHLASPISEAPKGYVPLDIKQYKNANDLLVKQGMADSQMVFHPAVAKKISEFTGALYGDEGTHAVLSAYDRLQNIWKASVTSIFPAFHGRNAISNVLQNFNDIGLEALNPVTHVQATQILHNNYVLNGLMKDSLGVGAKAEEAKLAVQDLMSKKIFTDNRGYTWTFGELRSVIKKNNIALKDSIIGQIDTAKSNKEVMDSLMAPSIKEQMIGGGAVNPLSQNFKPYQYGRVVGTAIEGQARMVNFLTNLRKTGDVDLAATRTKQFLFDYGHLTPFEKTVMKRIMPFYTFTRKNIEQQINTVLHAPGRTEAQLTALTTLGDAFSGQTLSPKEQAMLPSWMQGGIDILARRNGQNVEMVQSLGTPVEQPFQALQPNILLSSVSPFIRLPVELGSGYDFFQGKPLSDVTNAAALKNAPQAIKDYVGYTDVSFVDKNGKTVNHQVALDPVRLHMVLNLPLMSRIMSAMKQMDAVDVSTQNKILQQLLGIRPLAFNLDLEAQKRQKEMEVKLQTLLSQAGVGYQLQRFIPKQQ